MIKRIGVIAMACALAACTTDPYTGEQKVSKAAIGAVAGAALGAAVSSKSDRAKGAAIGAAVGGGSGYYFDRQERILRERLANTGVSVTRTAEGITLNMPGNISFPTAQYAILPSFYDVLDAVALVFAEFEKTNIKVSGHTDSVGSDTSNQTLSERRAEAVTAYFVSKGIPRGRFKTYGYGERYPVASNDTEAGRATNRRVEIEIVNM
jgi:outer membrane protein OmpA-like peptidoglycan-associated protein